MKKHFLFLGFAMLLSVASAFAQNCDYSGTTGTLEWCLKDGTLTISGEGEMPDYGYGGAPWCGYPESITTVVIETGVTTVGDWAFYHCYALASVTIPNSVTTIGDRAFSACIALESITIPNSVTWIGFWAFYTCTALKSITIPNSVTMIGENVFESCIALESITVESGNPNYSSADGVLFNKNKTALICYPAGKEGNNYAIPNSVTTIEDVAFYRCTALESIAIPNSVTMIGYDAFSSCNALESITIPNSVTWMGYFAFSDCSVLESITVESGNPNYSSSDGVLFDKDKTVLVGYPAGKTGNNYIIPNSVTTIGYQAFSRCIALESITIPNGVTTIGDWAFNSCNTLKSVTNLNPIPVDISIMVFNGVHISTCTLQVPTSAVSAYQSAEVWKEFNIEGIDVGIAEPENYPSLRIYPNPTTGLLTICDNRTSDVGQSEIVIYDVMGRVVHVETQCIASLQSHITPPPAPLPLLPPAFSPKEKRRGNDFFGGEFRKSEIGQSPIEIDISHLPQGVYGVSVISDGKVVGNGKVVKSEL